MDKLKVMTHDPETLREELYEMCRDQIDGQMQQVFHRFLTLYCRHLDLNDLQGRHVSDVLGSIRHWWHILQSFTGDSPKVRLFNPTLEVDGWAGVHSHLVVLQRDMPFLVDSLRMALNRRGLAIHFVKSTRLPVARDEKGQLQALPENTEADHTEALIVMEFNRVSDENFLHDLQQQLLGVLNDVAAVVADHQPLTEQTRQVATQLGRAGQACEPDENRAFLEWLIDNNFTFTGYTELDCINRDGERYLVENPDKRLGLFRLAQNGPEDKPESQWNAGIKAFYNSGDLIAFSKSALRSTVHRDAYSDYIVIKRLDDEGKVCGEARLMGLYTAPVYTMSPTRIPLIRRKVAEVFERSLLSPNSHDGKALQQVLETFPRDELFHSSTDQLFETVMGVVRINERYQVRLFMRRDSFGKFVTAIVYVPRDVFTTRLRRRIQQVLALAVNSTEYDFTTYFSESILARVHLVFRVNGDDAPDFDVPELQRQVSEIARAWEDHLQDELLEVYGEEQAHAIYTEYINAFPSAYQEHFEPRTAIQDIESVAQIKKTGQLAMSFYQSPGADHKHLRFKLFSLEETLALSDVIPVLEKLGLRVVAEHPYHIRPAGVDVWLHDFSLSHDLDEKISVREVRQTFQDAFAAIWQGQADSDAFNQLVLAARFDWREVSIFRAFAAYMHQTRFPYSEHYIANALANQVVITRKLLALFKVRFDPAYSDASRESRSEKLHQQIINDLDQVPNLNEDRIIRRYLALFQATLRCNYYQTDENGEYKPYLSFKVSPQLIPDLPQPRPRYEIFVYAPRMEGVHLRGGKVARGGLRWSDRLQDYRTEVLGLVKAQQVKNAVIVPNGAKGGFVCKKMPLNADRQAQQEEAIACYKWFIRGLLDITDNLVAGEIAPPEKVVRHDEDDPYLVVAADKGTASFSDIANGIAAEYGFWLHDAFASGGSQGYDHKGMGITARGAWVSVQRHFREKGINIQQQDFSVIGIGDMAGDVFGNGMLLSRHIRLLAAFNHQHVFVDPDPDPEKSFIERERLFKLPRSSWADYKASLISKGGGIFSRDEKSIKITAEMRECFAIEEDALTPSELIQALLKSPVDLLWNGGIGTYVKAQTESHEQVGDKANDNLRVNGDELRCHVIGEGGNLGMTQLGRVEYSLNGGACNTDFIDNAAGVDCSDHEVNIKILLNEAMQAGDLTEKQRNQLLVAMTDSVSALVLHNNYRQTEAVSLAQADALHRGTEYRRLINNWHQQGRMDRNLEFLPDDDTLAEREAQGIALTRPELAVLVSHAKVMLKNDLAEAGVDADEYMVKFALQAFPERLHKNYKRLIFRHRLRPELVATQVANDIVNTMGISFAQRLMDSTGADAGEMAKAYVIARDVFRLPQHWRAVEKLDYQLAPDTQMQLMADMMRRTRRAARWFLRNRSQQLQPAQTIADFAPAVAEIINSMPELLQGDELALWQIRQQQLTDQGLPDELVACLAVPGHLYTGLGMVDVAGRSGMELKAVARLYTSLSHLLQLFSFNNYISDLAVSSYWEAMARETYLDDLETQLRELTLTLSRFISGNESVEQLLEKWIDCQSQPIQRWLKMINEINNTPPNDFALVSVALRELVELVHDARDCGTLNDVDV